MLTILPHFAARIARQEAGRDPDGRQDVAVVTCCPGLGARRGPILGLAGAARVVDHDLDRPDKSLCLINKASYLVFIRQVADDDIGASALSGNVVSDLLGLGLASTVDDDSRALARKPSGYAFADALAAACDQRNPSVKFQIHHAVPM